MLLSNFRPIFRISQGFSLCHFVSSMLSKKKEDILGTNDEQDIYNHIEYYDYVEQI